MIDITDSVLDDDDEVAPESPSVVTPVKDVFISVDVCADQLFGASQPLEQTVDKRMSISTRFLSSSGCVIIALYNAHHRASFCIQCNSNPQFLFS